MPLREFGLRVMRERQSWLPVETLIVTGILGVVVSIALASYAPIASRFRMTEPAWMLGGVRISVHEFRALTGRWPGRDEVVLNGFQHFEEENPGLNRNVASLELQSGGALMFTLTPRATNGRGRRLSYRAGTIRDNPLSPIVWTCGYSSAQSPFALSSENRTDIDPQSLPSFCRDKTQKI